MTERVPNRHLAALITEAGFSHAGLARRVDQLGLEHGLDLRYDKTSVTRWLRGQHPRGATPALIAEVFTRRLGRRLSAQNLGLESCAPVYAGLEFAATPAEAVEIAASLWHKDTSPHADLHRVAFTPAGLVVPSRDWLIGRPDERVARGAQETPTDATQWNGSIPRQGGTTPSRWPHPGTSTARRPTVARPRPTEGPPATAPAESPFPEPDQPSSSPGAASQDVINQETVSPGGVGQVAAETCEESAGPETCTTATEGSTPPDTVRAAQLAVLPDVEEAADTVPTSDTEEPHEAEPGSPRAAQAQRVTSGDVAAVHAVGELFRALDHAYGGGHARHALVRYLEGEAEPMLRGRYTENIGRALFGAVAELTRLAGWTSFDIGSHGLGQRYFVQALRLSQAAADRVHGCYVLATMSRQAVHLGHGKEAVQLSRVAHQGASSGAPATVLALLHATEASGHATLGDERSCLAALSRAEHALGKARSADAAPGWVTFFDEAEFADEAAHCHLALGRHRGAVQHAERSLRLRSAKYARGQALCRLVLAHGWLGLGDVERACAHAGEAMDQIGGLRSARAADRFRQFVRRLAPYRDAAASRALTARVPETLRVPES